MDLLHRLRAKYHHIIEKKYVNTIRRKQFNLTIACDITFGVKVLAATLQVPRYVMMEHLLQVGMYYTLAAIRDEDKRRELQDHLVKAHLLGSELDERDKTLTFPAEN